MTILRSLFTNYPILISLLRPMGQNKHTNISEVIGCLPFTAGKALNRLVVVLAAIDRLPNDFASQRFWTAVDDTPRINSSIGDLDQLARPWDSEIGRRDGPQTCCTRP